MSLADRNLLFGVLALQMDFISREQLIAAVSAWILEKSKRISRVLQEQGVPVDETCRLLEPLVEKHLAMHDGDVEKGLAAVGVPDEVRSDLKGLGDPRVDETLAHVPTEPDEDRSSTTTSDRLRLPGGSSDACGCLSGLVWLVL